MFRWLRPLTWWKGLALGLILLLGASAAVTSVWVVRYALAIHGLRRGAGDTVFLWADGQQWFRMDEQHEPVPLSAIAPSLRQAVVAVEDHRFYHHLGIDPVGLVRAASHDVRDQQLVEGGSTLTQQLARTLYLSNNRTWGRKAKEAVLALLIEEQLSKDQILELYLNRIYLSGGVYGVEPIAKRLYGKRARDLSLAESAVIAGVIRAPSALSPWSNPEGAIRRSHTVLQRMREEGMISAADAEAALRARPTFQPYSPAAQAQSGYVRDYLRQQFRNQFGGDHPPDWRVQTTVVRSVQDAAERAMDAGLRRLGTNDLEAALVAIDPRTGNVLAMVGGRSFSEAPFNRATRSRRQPGSAFKPFVYAAALTQGTSPVSMLTGLAAMAPIGREEWAPHNAHLESADELSLRAALIESNNRAAVALQQKIGSTPIIRLAKAAGIPDQPDVPSLALGTGLVSPFDLTAAYAVFANGGLRVKPRSLVSVVDGRGDEVFATKVEQERVLSEHVAFQMVSMLQDVVARGTATGVRQAGIGFPVAGKTGTTDDFRDAWFVGFSTAVVAGVWVGFDQPASIGADAYGSRLALPIWAEFMRRSAKALPEPRAFDPPAGLEEVALCRVSYLRPVEGCPTYTEYFKPGDDTPTRLCPVHSGSIRQRVERAIGGFIETLGQKLRDLLGGK
ncbi:MAG TPA: PBP1A family penicillin-binding protein [Vicinamibacterales bacterium]